MVAAGRLIVRSEDGQIALVEANPAGSKELGRFIPPNRSGSQSKTYPVVASGKLLVRDQDLFFGYDLRGNFEVIRQKAHRECYDHQVTACGVKLVDVETPEELERAVNPRTAMMLAYNVREENGRIGHRDWVAAARRHRVPTLLDAAADTPPRERLWEYNALGFDLVAFSGGKALRGPQNAGLLLGRKDLIEVAKLNTSPNCGTIGRGLKVSKEDMVAMWAAVERFMRLDLAAEEREWKRRIEVIVAAVSRLPTLKTETIVPPVANHVPHLLLHWDEERVKITPEEVKAMLAEGHPPIATARVHGTGTTGFLLSVFMLQPGEEQIVADRVREVLEQAALL